MIKVKSILCLHKTFMEEKNNLNNLQLKKPFYIFHEHVTVHTQKS